MIIKKYDPKFKNHDRAAKEAYLKWRNQNGVRAKVNPNIYGIDILGVAPGEPNAEVRMTTSWKGDKKYPHTDITFYQRKMPSLLKGLVGDRELHFIVVSVDSKMAYRIPAINITNFKEGLKKEWNSDHKIWEKVWHLPLNMFTKIDLEGMVW